MLFRKMIFVMKTPEAYVKPHMNGFGDPTIRDYCPLSLTPAYKPEGRNRHGRNMYSPMLMLQSCLQRAGLLIILHRLPWFFNSILPLFRVCFYAAKRLN